MESSVSPMAAFASILCCLPSGLVSPRCWTSSFGRFVPLRFRQNFFQCPIFPQNLHASLYAGHALGGWALPQLPHAWPTWSTLFSGVLVRFWISCRPARMASKRLSVCKCVCQLVAFGFSQQFTLECFDWCGCNHEFNDPFLQFTLFKFTLEGLSACSGYKVIDRFLTSLPVVHQVETMHSEVEICL